MSESMRSQEADLFELELNVRAWNALWRHGIRLISDLKMLSYEDLLEIPHLGKESADHICDKLLAYDGTVLPKSEQTTICFPIGSMNKADVTVLHPDSDVPCLLVKPRGAKQTDVAAMIRINLKTGDILVSREGELLSIAHRTGLVQEQ